MSNNFTWSWEVIESPWSYNSKYRALFGREHGTGNKKINNCYYRQHFHWLSFQPRHAFFSPIVSYFLLCCERVWRQEEVKGPEGGKRESKTECMTQPWPQPTSRLTLSPYLISYPLFPLSVILPSPTEVEELSLEWMSSLVLSAVPFTCTSETLLLSVFLTY